MKLQLAKLYHGDLFMGFGLAADGQLLENQISTAINTSTKEGATITATFLMSKELSDNQISINLNPGCNLSKG